MHFFPMVGVLGFEPRISCTPCKRDTGLRYTPAAGKTCAFTPQTSGASCAGLPTAPYPDEHCHSTECQQFCQRWYTYPMLTTRRWIDSLMLVLALIGLIDAAYLTLQHYQNAIPPCTLRGCEVVLTSTYASVGNIPVSLFGVVYYAFVAMLLGKYFFRRHHTLLMLASFCTIAGFAASVYLVYVQIALLHSICQYCMVSAVTSTLLFVFGMIVLIRGKQPPERILEGP